MRGDSVLNAFPCMAPNPWVTCGCLCSTPPIQHPRPACDPCAGLTRESSKICSSKWHAPRAAAHSGISLQQRAAHLPHAATPLPGRALCACRPPARLKQRPKRSLASNGTLECRGARLGFVDHAGGQGSACGVLGALVAPSSPCGVSCQCSAAAAKQAQ